MDLADLRNFRKKMLEPDFGDEASHADQQNLLTPQGLAHRKRPALLPVKNHQRVVVLRKRSFCGQNSFGELLWTIFQTEVTQQLLGADSPVRLPAEKRERPSRTDNWIQQATGGNTVTKLQSV